MSLSQWIILCFIFLMNIDSLTFVTRIKFQDLSKPGKSNFLLMYQCHIQRFLGHTTFLKLVGGWFSDT